MSMITHKDRLLNRKAWAVDLFLSAASEICKQRALEAEKISEQTATEFLHWRHLCKQQGMDLNTSPYSIQAVLRIMESARPLDNLTKLAGRDWQRVRKAIRMHFMHLLPTREHMVTAACDRLTYGNITETKLWHDLQLRSHNVPTIMENQSLPKNHASKRQRQEPSANLSPSEYLDISSCVGATFDRAMSLYTQDVRRMSPDDHSAAVSDMVAKLNEEIRLLQHTETPFPWSQWGTLEEAKTVCKDYVLKQFVRLSTHKTTLNEEQKQTSQTLSRTAEETKGIPICLFVEQQLRLQEQTIRKRELEALSFLSAALGCTKPPETYKARKQFQALTDKCKQQQQVLRSEYDLSESHLQTKQATLTTARKEAFELCCLEDACVYALQITQPWTESAGFLNNLHAVKMKAIQHIDTEMKHTALDTFRKWLDRKAAEECSLKLTPLLDQARANLKRWVTECTAYGLEIKALKQEDSDTGWRDFPIGFSGATHIVSQKLHDDFVNWIQTLLQKHAKLQKLSCGTVDQAHLTACREIVESAGPLSICTYYDDLVSFFYMECVCQLH
jgi:hypothetical protein